MDTVFVVNSSSSFQWTAIISALTGGLLAIIPLAISHWINRKRELNLWFFDQYINKGIDIIISNLNHLNAGYNFILMHKDHPGINARKKAQRYIKGGDLKMIADASKKLETITFCDHISTLLIALNDDMCYAIKDKDLKNRCAVLPTIIEYFHKLRKIIVQIRIRNIADIYQVGLNEDIERETKSSDIKSIIDRLVRDIGENYPQKNKENSDAVDIVTERAETTTERPPEKI